METKYIFICGAGRSGTTFLRQVLNNNPSIMIATEIHFFSNLFHNGFLSNYKKMKMSKGDITINDLIHLLIKDKHFGIYWKQKRSYNAIDIKNYFKKKSINKKNIYLFLIENDYIIRRKIKHKLTHLGEKTPLNIFHVDRLLKWFPHAKILFIYRNPIDVLRSEVNKVKKPDYRFNRKNNIYSLGLTFFVFFEWLFAAVIAIINFNRNKQNFLIISLKQLSLCQKESLQKICFKISVSYNKSMCVYKKVGTSYKAGYEAKYWEPNKFIVFIYKIFLYPIYKHLNLKALNNRTKS